MCKSKATFWLSCMGYLGLLVLVAGESGLAEREKVQAATKQAPAGVEFQNISMGEMRDKDGVHLGFTAFK
ncbi:MAG: hypothetical protein WA829_11015, partial [Candidatus Acidiferrum sp.]